MCIQAASWEQLRLVQNGQVPLLMIFSEKIYFFFLMTITTWYNEDLHTFTISLTHNS